MATIEKKCIKRNIKELTDDMKEMGDIMYRNNFQIDIGRSRMLSHLAQTYTQDGNKLRVKFFVTENGQPFKDLCARPLALQQHITVHLYDLQGNEYAIIQYVVSAPRVYHISMETDPAVIEPLSVTMEWDIVNSSFGVPVEKVKSD